MENITYGKPVHASAAQETAGAVTDPKNAQAWEAPMYPAYLDIDLQENYRIGRIRVRTPEQGVTQYAVYASMDGVNFDRVANRMEQTPCPACGDVFSLDREARIVRVLVKYYSESCKAILLSVEAEGEKTGTPVQYPEPVNVPAFQGSAFDVPVTGQDTIQAVQGIVERNLGPEYVGWFDFQLSKDDKLDAFTVSSGENRVNISGNSGVSLAAGLNFYLKQYCHVLIAQVGSQVKMPCAPVPVEGTVVRKTPFALRYAYNYCTHSYTMAFWGEREWQRELDWLALNGVTIVLDIVAQEEVWRRFLEVLGYSHAEIKDFLVGPAYGAWAYMANLSGFGGPLHDSWFARRTQLARKNHRFMRTMGMQPVLQGYSGMVPCDILKKDPQAQVIPQGLWNSFQRPAMLRTNTPTYAKYAALFYEAQRQTYGDVSRYFATDPFHEGGNRAGLSSAQVSRNILTALRREHPDNVWVIQSWGENPSPGLLWGLGRYRGNALVLDLYAEVRPRWKHWGGREFAFTPWLYCMLNNFGGRMGLRGHPDTLVKEIPNAQAKAKCMRGVGITPEATRSNPVLFDLFFELIWSETGETLPHITLEEWLDGYAQRRYGARNAQTKQAMRLLHQTVYKTEKKQTGEGAPESVVNARPALDISSASTWGNGVVDYDKQTLEEAARALLAAYDACAGSPGYLFDLADCLKQVLSNTAQELHIRMARAYRDKNRGEFERYSKRFLSLIDMEERVLGTEPEFLLGTWMEQASRLAEKTDAFTKDMFAFNAKALITTWGAVEQADKGMLKDYSNKQWAGLTREYYRPRWETWIANRLRELDGGAPVREDWFPMEWQWVWKETEYPAKTSGESLKQLGEEVLREFSVRGL